MDELFRDRLLNYNRFVISVGGRVGSGKTTGARTLHDLLRINLPSFGVINMSDVILRECGRDEHGEGRYYFRQVDGVWVVNEELKAKDRKGIITPYSCRRMAANPYCWLQLVLTGEKNLIITGLDRTEADTEVAALLGRHLCRVYIDSSVENCARRRFPDLPPPIARTRYEEECLASKLELHAASNRHLADLFVTNDGSETAFNEGLEGLVSHFTAAFVASHAAVSPPNLVTASAAW